MVRLEKAWDERYQSHERLWSGEPNGTLVSEIGKLPIGRVLDVGCGEGADAVWLSRQGWRVTGLEISGVALARARGHAEDAGVSVNWVHSGLVEAELVPESFDLVSAQYPVLLRTPTFDSERALMDAVAPGGTLLVVHHIFSDEHGPRDDGQFTRADFLTVDDVAQRLDSRWTVLVNETRERPIPPSGAGVHHQHDRVLRAVKNVGVAASS